MRLVMRKEQSPKTSGRNKEASLLRALLCFPPCPGVGSGLDFIIPRNTNPVMQRFGELSAGVLDWLCSGVACAAGSKPC